MTRQATAERIREFHINDVPDQWANGEPIPEYQRLQIALLRVAGCRCELPIMRSAQSFTYPDADPVGVRCKVCDAHAFVTPPTAEMKMSRAHRSHRLTRQMMAERQAGGQEIPDFLAELAACQPEFGCGPGCGCEEDEVSDASGTRAVR